MINFIFMIIYNLKSNCRLLPPPTTLPRGVIVIFDKAVLTKFFFNYNIQYKSLKRPRTTGKTSDIEIQLCRILFNVIGLTP